MQLTFNELVGEIFLKIEVYDERIVFYTQYKKYIMQHIQDCCESVTLEDIAGDMNCLLFTPIVKSEETKNKENSKNDYDESFTWTFYNISTVKGSVTIRWYGTSNGYYSESVDFCEQELSDEEFEEMSKIVKDHEIISVNFSKLKRKMQL